MKAAARGRPAQAPHIADQLRGRLRDGFYPPYERLPPARVLAEEFGIGSGVMVRAIRILQDEGAVWTNVTGTYDMNIADSPEPPARDILALFGIPQDVVDEILDIHAHQLAEKQRAWLKFQGYGPDEEPCPCGGCSWCLAQDYIDHIDPRAQP